LDFNITKKDKDADFWPRITKVKAKYPYIAIDWGKWVDDEDEEEEAPAGDYDFGNLGGLGGFGGGDDAESDDDDGPPGLESDDMPDLEPSN
jgi:hypothetical protein